MKDSLKRAFVRFGRLAAAQTIVLGTDFAIGALSGVKLPPEFQPLLPLVVAPLLNAAAKVVRDLDPENKVAKVL